MDTPETRSSSALFSKTITPGKLLAARTLRFTCFVVRIDHAVQDMGPDLCVEKLSPRPVGMQDLRMNSHVCIIRKRVENWLLNSNGRSIHNRVRSFQEALDRNSPGTTHAVFRPTFSRPRFRFGIRGTPCMSFLHDPELTEPRCGKFGRIVR